MYSSEDLEMFYLDYQSEWVPRGMTLQAYCSRNNVPYKVMENYSRNIQKKIVEIKVVGRPTEESQQSVSLSPSSVQPQSEQLFKRELMRSISVAIRFGDGKEVSRKGLDYVGLKLRCKYNRILAVIRYQLGREPEQGDVFIVMSKNRRLIRLFAYDKISCQLFEKRFVPEYEFMKVEYDGEQPVYRMDWKDLVTLLERPVRKKLRLK